MSRSLGLSALVLLFVSANASLAVDSQPVTGVSQDGVCGNGITCVGSEYGNCCSIDGACGSSSVECGVGCQSLFGVCPDAPLKVNHDDEYAILFERAVEERAVASATSSVCTSATARRTTSSSILTTSTTTKPTTTSSSKKTTTTTHSISKRAASSVTCVASQTSLIRVNRPSPSTDSWCNSWLAARPHPNSPFPKIPNPLDVSNACICILQADASSSTVKTTTTSTSATCAPSVTALLRVDRPSTDSWCTTWLAQRPHSNSPFPKIPNPLDVSNACQCILSADAASSKTSSKTSSTTTKTTSTTTSKSTTTTTTSSLTTKAASSTSTAKACSLKKRRRRRRDIPLTLEFAV